MESPAEIANHFAWSRRSGGVRLRGMTGRILRIFYDDALLARARAGEHNYTNRLIAAFASRGVETRLMRNSETARQASAGKDGYALFHMDDPLHARSLTTRLAYFYPFWRIERSAKRWEWEVALSAFAPRDVDPAAAETFFRRARERYFPGDAANARRDGFVYVALQGRLLQHRSFQTMSPLDMLGETLAHTGDRRIVAGLHPKETYSPAERAALDDLARLNPRLSIRTGEMPALLRECDFVVTQNSSAALAGYFFRKPAVLFGMIDFHHIAANVGQSGVEAAFRQVEEMRPDYAAYLHWFLKETTINAGAPEAEAQILRAVKRRGWMF